MHFARLLTVVALLFVASSSSRAADPVRVGVIGFDNYQGLEYVMMFSNVKADPTFEGMRVTAIYPVGSDDYPESAALAARWTSQLEAVYKRLKNPEQAAPQPEIVSSIDAVLAKCDVVLMAGLDGRLHLKQATPVLKAGKRLYICRPLAANAADAVAILKLAAETKTPCFSSSQHRFSPGFIGMRNHPEVGKVLGCDVYGGFDLKHAQADEFIRPLHSLETIYTIMGPGVERVSCTATPTAESFTMVWKDGRVGTYRGIKEGKQKWSATVFGDAGVSTAGIYGHGVPAQGVVPSKDEYMGYKGIGLEIAKFFKGGPLPVEPRETLEIYGVMQAAEDSRAKGGAFVPVPDLWNGTK